MKHLKTPEHCSHWLENKNSLLTLYQHKTQQLLELNTLWKRHIEPDLGSNSCIANFQAGTLVIEVENASWGMRLRYHVPDLLKQLQTWNLLKELEKITWYIKPRDYLIIDKPLPRPSRVLSQEVKELLHEVSHTVVHDKLKIALRHLANAKK